jgi:hypothetical protein
MESQTKTKTKKITWKIQILNTFDKNEVIEEEIIPNLKESKFIKVLGWNVKKLRNIYHGGSGKHTNIKIIKILKP